MTNNASTPLIRWAGSKRKLLPKLTPFWNGDDQRYIEPFFGSGALFFAIAPKRAVLSDINTELIESYRTLVESPEEVYDSVTQLPVSKRRYISLRSTDPTKLSPIERTIRFLYLNRYCFNGIYRTNTAGGFNVPFAAAGTGTFPDWQTFNSAVQRLKKATLVSGDFEVVIRKHVAPHDFVYLDPPYAVTNRRIFKQYGPQTFGLDDLERLANCLYIIDAIGAKFVLSYAYCSEALYFFRDWNSRKVYTQRNISGFSKHRRTAAELLVTNR